MISFLIYLFNFVKDVGYFGFVLSYKTGQLIIYFLNNTVEVFMQINKIVGTLLRVLFEDFYIFLCDVGQRLLNVVTIICSVFQSIVSAITNLVDAIRIIFSSIAFIIHAINNGTFGVIAKVISGIGQAFTALKQFFVLLGASIWFAVTLIPLCIVYTCTMFTYYFGCLLDEIIKLFVNSLTNCKNFINNLYEFITDVPVESIAGLITGACIMYVIIKFHILLYHKIISLLELIKHNIHQIRVRLLRRLTALRPIRQPQQEQSSSSESYQTESDSEAEVSEESDANCSTGNEIRMCIICQERNKCILMLPCRHVCVCSVCYDRLRNYNRTCPICRSLVERTMKVFV